MLSDEAACRDRAVGCLLGLAIGDALGTTLEFSPRDSYPPLIGMVGGGPFNRKPGEWTDDTAMALALAESLIAHPGFDEADLLDRFVDWWRNGTYSCVGVCDDIGATTQAALIRWQLTGAIHAGSTDPCTAGNGSLMRLAPVAIAFWRDRPKLREAAARQSRTTHGAPEAVNACIAFAEILADAISGLPKAEVLRNRPNCYAGHIRGIVAGSWRGKRREQIRSTGYVAHTLEAALWCVDQTSTFEKAVLLAANLGEDADTTAAVTGQLAAAIYGESALPGGLRNPIAWRSRLSASAAASFEMQDTR